MCVCVVLACAVLNLNLRALEPRHLDPTTRVTLQGTCWSYTAGPGASQDGTAAELETEPAAMFVPAGRHATAGPPRDVAVSCHLPAVFVRMLRALNPDNPFDLYGCAPASRAPAHPQAWSELWRELAHILVRLCDGSTIKVLRVVRAASAVRGFGKAPRLPTGVSEEARAAAAADEVDRLDRLATLQAARQALQPAVINLLLGKRAPHFAPEVAARHDAAQHKLGHGPRNVYQQVELLLVADSVPESRMPLMLPSSVSHLHASSTLLQYFLGAVASQHFHLDLPRPWSYGGERLKADFCHSFAHTHAFELANVSKPALRVRSLTAW